MNPVCLPYLPNKLREREREREIWKLKSKSGTEERICEWKYNKMGGFFILEFSIGMDSAAKLGTHQYLQYYACRRF
jgi:hypothetical protein